MTAQDKPVLVSRLGLNEFTDASDPTINRWMKAGKFPAPITEINGRRFWNRDHLLEWSGGRTFGWSGVDAGFAERQRQAEKRTEALRAWHAARKGRASPLAAA
jgi:hypothetical protein